MNDKKVYIINYKETTVDENGVMHTEAGTFDHGYTDEEKCKKHLYDTAHGKAVEVNGDCYVNVSKDYASVTNDHGTGCDCYEYSVVAVYIAAND